MTEALKEHPKLLVKVSEGKQTDCLEKTSVARMEILVIIGMFPNTQNSYLQVAANSGGYKHTAKSADEKGNPASMAIHLQLNDERQLQLRKIQSDDKNQFRVRLHHLEYKYVLKRENWDLRLVSSRQDLKISEIRTLQHSKKDLSNGL